MCPLSLALNRPDKCDSLKHVTAFDPLLYHKVTLSETFVSVRSTVIPRQCAISLCTSRISLKRVLIEEYIQRIRSVECSFSFFGLACIPIIVWGEVKVKRTKSSSVHIFVQGATVKRTISTTTNRVNDENNIKLLQETYCMKI